MFWLRNKKKIQLRPLIWRPVDYDGRMSVSCALFLNFLYLNFMHMYVHVGVEVGDLREYPYIYIIKIVYRVHLRKFICFYM